MISYYQMIILLLISRGKYLIRLITSICIITCIITCIYYFYVYQLVCDYLLFVYIYYLYVYLLIVSM